MGVIFKRKKKDLSYIDERNIYVHTMEVILSQKCNLACKHCLRGESTNKEITDDVLDAIFSKIHVIDSLGLGGGELTLSPTLLKKVYISLVKNDTIVYNINFTTNGTRYSEELVNILKELNRYIEDCRKKLLFKDFVMEPVTICFSLDNFHLSELQRVGFSREKLFENIAKFKKVFGENAIEYRYISDIDIYNTGRAKNLKGYDKIEEYKSMLYPISESTNSAYIGGIICFSTDGECIPVNIPFNRENKESYGNIKYESLSTILKRMNTEQVPFFRFNSYYKKMYYDISPSKEKINLHKKELIEKKSYIERNVYEAEERLKNGEREQ